MADKVRVMVAGAGAFGGEHLRTLASMEGVRLAGVADLRPEAAKEAAGHHRVPEWDVDALGLMDRVEPDGLVVATPGDTHVALASAALSRGIAVLVEKPVAMTVAEAKTLAGVKPAGAAFVLPGHILRFSDSHRALVEIVRSGAIGPVLSVTSRRHRDDSHAVRYPDIDPVLMTMVHDIDLALWITQAPVDRVFAVRRPQGRQRSETLMLAIGSNGAVWNLSTAWTFPAEAPPDRVEVIGEAGGVELEIGRRIRQYGTENRHIELGGSASEDPLRAELSYFVTCIETGESPRVVTLGEAIAGLAVAEAAIASLRCGTMVRP